jgi:serine/threonine transporter
MSMVSNPVDALLNANYIGILVWAVGLASPCATVTTPPKPDQRYVPRGDLHRQSGDPFCTAEIFGLVSSTLATTGFETLWGYAQLLLVLVAVCCWWRW